MMFSDEAKDLIYCIDQNNTLLLERLADVRNARRSRLEKIIKRLHEMGMDV